MEPPPLHPGPTSRGGRPYDVLGVPAPGDPEDSVYRLCYQCGYPCRTDRDQNGPSLDSPGLTQVTVNVPILARFGGGTVAKIEMCVEAGCPFCGSLNYEGKCRDDYGRQARNPRIRR